MQIDSFEAMLFSSRFPDAESIINAGACSSGRYGCLQDANRFISARDLQKTHVLLYYCTVLGTDYLIPGRIK